MAVVLVSGSLGTASTTSITGLTSGKRYKVTTLGFTYPVAAGGTLGTPGASVMYANLSNLTGTSITGLTDGQAYLVQEVTANSASSTGVNPVHAITFGINTSGRTGNTSTVVTDTETLGISFDNGVEEWTPMDTQGWVRRLMTAKSVAISLSSKRNYGDTGNDYVAGMAYKNGQDCNSTFYIGFPNGDTVSIPCVVSVTSDGGDSTGAQTIEWEVQSDGKPTYTTAHS